MQYHEIVTDVHQRIIPYIKQTPLITSEYFSQKIGSSIYFKCENLQHTNSFKVRGAFHKISKITNKKNKILITASGGNHGLAVAYAANKFGMNAVIVVPEFVPRYRIEMIKKLGAKVIVYGKTMDDLDQKVMELSKDLKYCSIHSFDDEDIIAGQATVAHELLQEIPDIDAILVSVGGGGLISGIAQYAKSFNPAILIYGTQTIGSDAMSQSLQMNKIKALPEITSIATSLGVTKVSERTFAIVKKNVEAVVTVTDEDALRDLKILLHTEKLLIEPAAACNLSALIAGKFPDLRNKKVAVILCGGNFSLEQLKVYL